MGRRGARARLLVYLVILVFAAGLGGRLALHKLYPLGYRDAIDRWSRAYGLDPYLVAAVIRAESRFRPEATSPEGARGLMQVMPATGRWAAEQLGLPFEPDYLYNPDYNIRIGCWYLATLLGEFGGDVVTALAAYNGGLTNVRRWLDEQRWTGERHTLDQIPFSETRRYVDVVLKSQQRYYWLYGEWRYGGAGEGRRLEEPA